MEKLLDYKKINVSSWMDNSKMYRFQCDCLTPEDALDVDVDEAEPDKKYIVLRMSLKNMSFLNKLKFLFKGNWCWREFVVREEDYKDLSDIFNPDRKYSELK